MRIKLTLRRPEERMTDLEVTADATATVADVASALYRGDPLRAGVEAPETLTLQVEESDGGPGGGVRTLRRDADLIQAGLRSGAIVSIAQAGTQYASPGEGRGPAMALLRVLQGPEAGREIPLPSGASIVGRDGDVDVRILDPTLSHRHCRLNVSDKIEVLDLDSANGVIVGDRVVERARIGPEDTVTVGDTTFSVARLQRPGGTDAASPVVQFNRSPRVVPRFEPCVLEAPEPPREQAPPAFPLLLLLAPLLVGGAIFAVTGNPRSLLFVLLMPVMAVAAHLNRRLQQRADLRRQIARFSEGMDALRAQVRAAQERERVVRHAETPSATDAIEHAWRLGPLLWTHRPEHASFATVRLGRGAAPSRVRIELPGTHGSAPRFRHEALALRDAHSLVEDVPIVADLRACGSVGVAGAGERAQGAARGIVSQLACLHSPADLALAVVASATSRSRWEWLVWLPHTSSPHSPLPGDHLAANAEQGAALVARIEELVAERGGGEAAPRGPLTNGPDGGPAATAVLPLLVVLVEDDTPVDRARLVRLAELGPDVGVHLLWCATDVLALPAACRTFVDVGADDATAGQVRLGEHTVPVEIEIVGADAAARVSRHLAPVVDAGVPLADDSDLPRSISWLQLAGRDLARDERAVVERWAENGSLVSALGAGAVRRGQDPGLRAVVGHDGTAPLLLDLRAQGPHALVGGTTGAGKSELLQAWVMGMAAAHGPDRVTFLFVDYKGGAAFADAVALPHAVGLVTDLSPHLVRRALTSLRAELHHRERLLQRKRAKDLVTLERSGDPECPPSLVIVVDEFAALAREVPEFVDGVVDVAARGRSLGLHLILATQRPAGVIKESLRANTNLRVALRMADEADSLDILGDRMAAHFDPGIPGRAAVRTGPGRVATFQTGYAGGWTPAESEGAPIEIVERPFGTGASWSLPASATGVEDPPGPTDIARAVRTFRRAAAEAEVPAPRRPWLEELADVYDLSRLPARRTDDELVLGVADVPEEQTQPTVSYLPDRDGNMAVYGTGGAGKSTVLRTLAIAAASTVRGGPVHVYGIDAGSAGLAMLEELPHVGSIVSGDDEERVIRLLRMLRRLIDERAAAFAAVGAGSVSEYRERAGRPATPRILLLVDGMAAFREGFDHGALATWFSAFVQIAADGRPMGVHVVVTGDRAGAIPTSLGSSIQRRLVLRMASTDDYALLGAPKDVLDATSPPGRGILAGHEVQVAVHGGDGNVAVQGREIAHLAAAMRRAGVAAAPPIARLPEHVELGTLRPEVDGLPVIGLDDETLSEATIEPRGTFLVSGPPGSGRTTALATIATSLREGGSPARRVRLSARPGQLAGLDVWDLEASGADQARQLAAQLVGAIESGAVAPGRLAVFLEGLADFAAPGVEGELERLVRACARSGQFVVAEGESSTWSQAPQLARPFKAGRRGLLLQPSDGEGDALLGTSLGRSRGAQLPPGRGFLVAGGRPRRVQIARTGD